MRRWLIDPSARAFDAAAFWYVVLLAGMTVVCLITAAGWALLGCLGYPLP